MFIVQLLFRQASRRLLLRDDDVKTFYFCAAVLSLQLYKHLIYNNVWCSRKKIIEMKQFCASRLSCFCFWSFCLFTFPFHRRNLPALSCGKKRIIK